MGVVCQMDEVLVHAPTQELHDDRLLTLLECLELAGRTLKAKFELEYSIPIQSPQRVTKQKHSVVVRPKAKHCF